MDKITGILRTPDGKIFYPRPYYRIGDILESTNSTNPGDDGYIGTWELYGIGRVTVCIDSNDTDFETIGKTGGEKKHTLTVNEMPSHSHKYKLAYNITGNASGLGYAETVAGTFSGDLIENTGGGQSHENMPPYITVYRWRRIA